ncbi:MAG: gliding motility-associated C-terminal domain-containing protein, partial [Mariniphaga sp.]|nr:gliding motility-associated C-terminal domain-containing protein [Mariniphaga sp.]
TWDNGETVATATALNAGSHSVLVKDANGAETTCTVVISQPDELVVALDGEPANVTCNGAADGTISISVEGGTEAYTIVWTKDGETFTTEDGYNLTGLEPGSYAVTVTDANGCVAELEDIVITQPELLSCNIEVNNNVSINALDDGSATVIVSGGNEGDFTYLWDNGETTQTAINLSAGIHTVLVTDSKGCQTSCEVEITQPDVLECNVRLSSPISCAGEEDAVISVFVGGGYRPYTYEWSTGHIVPTVNNLGAGTYFVTVTDAMNAQTECSITIEAPEELVADLAGEVTDVTCFGGSDGAISIVVSGGTEKYGFTWTKDGEIFSTEQNLTGLSAGTYAVEVTDAHGCTAVVQDIIVGQPDELVVSLEGEASSVTCFGAADGAISIAVSGGTGEYTIVWTKNGEPFAAEDGYNLTGLEPGAYAVVVYDAHQCSAMLDEVVVLTQPDELTVSLEGEITDVICYGDSNGAISIAVSGGTGKYGFTWTKDGEAFTPKDNYSLSALAAGIYSVVVTDENGCSAELSGIVVASPEAALACSTEMTKPVTEYGQSNGEATVTATGGWGDYTYIWSNGQTTTTATGLEAGTYTVTVTDSRGCETTCEVTITGPDQLVCSIEMDSPVVCYGGADGKATVTVTGGVTPYTYAWDNGETGATAIGLDAGTHTVTVTDASGAQSTCEVIITQPESALQLTAEALNVVTCYDGSDGQATAEATGGWGNYTYSWSNGQTTATATGLEAGVYTVTVTDAQGCEDTREVEIAGPATALECSAEVVSHVTIADANNGEAVVFANGGWGDYTYHWSNGQATANAMGLAPGTYTVTVTDAQGCETQCSVTILLDVTEEDCELYIPDAFSPNDDGSNDYFKVLCIEKYPNAKFEVYNRWGNLLYEQENYGNQDRWNSIDAWWDGTSNRKWTVGREKLPMGTYFYILHLNDGSKPITGSVFLNK